MKMRKMTVTFLVVVFLVLAKPAMAMPPIPPELKSIVTFVFVEKIGRGLVPHGTAFFVSVPHPKEADRAFIYLVTAKHVLQDSETKSFLSKISVRLNLEEGGTKLVSIPLVEEGPAKNIFVHEDSTVDLVVIPCLPNEKMFEFKHLPSDYIPGKADFDNLEIREGSEIFFTGLFAPHIGSKKNYPISRFGRVAMISDERINWGGVDTIMFLTECPSFGGNSGSPVFFYPGAERNPGTIFLGRPVIKLAGIMKGAFRDPQILGITEIEAENTSKILFSWNNMGISAVTPAYLLQEILVSEELKGLRDKAKSR